MKVGNKAQAWDNSLSSCPNSIFVMLILVLSLSAMFHYNTATSDKYNKLTTSFV